MTLTAHLHLVQGLRMNGARPLLLLYADVVRVREVKLQGTSDVLFFSHIFHRICLFGITVNVSAEAGPRKTKF